MKCLPLIQSIVLVILNYVHSKYLRFRLANTWLCLFAANGIATFPTAHAHRFSIARSHTQNDEKAHFSVFIRSGAFMINSNRRNYYCFVSFFCWQNCFVFVARLYFLAANSNNGDLIESYKFTFVYLRLSCGQRFANFISHYFICMRLSYLNDSK